MASPNFDSLNIQHSRNIGDAVTVASTDGNLFTSTQRTTHLNNSIRRWLITQMSLKNYNALIEYITDVQVDLDANGEYLLSNLSNDCAEILDIYSVFLNAIVTRGNERLFGHYQTGTQNNKNTFLAPSTTNPIFIYSGGKVKIFPLNNNPVTQSIKLHYVKQHSNLTVANATDILVPSQYWHQIIDLALVEAINEMPSEVALARGKMKQDLFSNETSLIGNSDIKNS